MKYILRDDDTNYFTDYRDLEEAYSEIWDIHPVTLFVIPFVMGNWKKWLYIRHFEYENLDIEIYKLDKKVYPIGDNRELVDFIKNKIIENRIIIGIHGIHHRNLDEITPVFKNNRGENAEFYTKKDYTIQLIEAKKYLEDLFETKVYLFSPPQNLINNQGRRSVRNSGLNLIYNRNPKRIINNIMEVGIKNAIFLFIKGIIKRFIDKSYIIHVKPLVTNNYIEYSYLSLQPNTNTQELEDKIKYIIKKGKYVCLSTHYFALQYEFSKSYELKDKLLYLVKEYFKG